jgi:hypothetical protein
MPRIRGLINKPKAVGHSTNLFSVDFGRSHWQIEMSGDTEWYPQKNAANV